MSEDIVRALAYAAVWVVLIQSATTYLIAYLCVTGRSVFELFKARTDAEVLEDRRRHASGKIHLIDGGDGR